VFAARNSHSKIRDDNIGWLSYSMPSTSTSSVISMIHSASYRRKKHAFFQFGALLYTKVRTKALLAAEAPGQDLSLWTDPGKYESVDQRLASLPEKS